MDVTLKVRICSALVVIGCWLGSMPAFADIPNQPQSTDKVQEPKKQPKKTKARHASLKKKAPAATKPVNTAAAQDSGKSQQSTPPAPTPPAQEGTVSTVAKATPPQTEASDQQQPKKEEKPRLDLYGFAMLDMGYDNGQNDPNWFDVMRPTKLPSFPNEFGHDGRFYAGVRQSRFGA